MKNGEMKKKNPGLTDGQKLEKYKILLKDRGVTFFEYYLAYDVLVVYDEAFRVISKQGHYLSILEQTEQLLPEDRKKLICFYQDTQPGTMEIRLLEKDGSSARMVLDARRVRDEAVGEDILLGTARDITQAKIREEILEGQAQRDSLTNLYNSSFGKELINEYLNKKSPYTSCGMLLVDVDYFKNVNDSYGHLFGDTVLTALADFLKHFFRSQDIIMRPGGDEFVVLVKDIAHNHLVKKVAELVETVRNLKYEGNTYAMTCSVGVCYLPENSPGYTYEQLFKKCGLGALSRQGGRKKPLCIL